MAQLIARFVDSIAANPVVRMDVNDGDIWRLHSTSEFDPPRAKRARVSTLMTDGARYPATAYDDRVLVLRWTLQGASSDDVAGELQRLARELDRPSNILEYRPPAGSAVFFRTHRLGLDVASMPTDGTVHDVEVAVPAEPFAYGLKESLGPFTVANDSAAGATLNANPYFETDVSSWTVTGGTFVRSTAQSHEGAASGLLTPDGVSAAATARCELVPAAVGATYRAAAWVRCAVARSIGININWRDSGGGLLSTSNVTVAVAATTWTFLEVAAPAPASTTQAQMNVSMGSTPPAGHTLHIDEALFWREGTDGAQQFDIAAGVIKGDVDTPAIVRLAYNSATFSTSLLAVRRRDLDGLHYGLQVESGTMSTDTTVQANDTAMSGAGSNFVRTTFATDAAMVNRVTFTSPWPAGPSHQRYRGKYRLLLRCRHSVLNDVIRVRLLWGGTATNNAIVGPSASVELFNGLLHWVDLGVFALPPSPDPIYEGYSGTALPVSGVQMAVQAQRVSGSGNLDMDVLVAVPCDGDFAFVTWRTVVGEFPALATVDGVWGMAYGQDADLTIPDHTGISVAGTFPALTPGVANRIYFMPTLAGQPGIGGDSLATTTAVNLDYWPRYLTVRPVAT